MTAAAMTGPTPNSLVRLVPVAWTAVASFFLAARRRPDHLQDPGDASAGDRLGHAAGDQLAQHRMQPAGDLGPGPAQVPVPL